MKQRVVAVSNLQVDGVKKERILIDRGVREREPTIEPVVPV